MLGRNKSDLDVIGDATARIRTTHFRAEAATQAPIDHVCKGCDAKLYREDAWYNPDASYDTDAEWAREEEESRDAIRVALADQPRAQDRVEVPDVATDVVVDNDLVIRTGTAVARLDQ